jgi:hypothetical protein
MTCHQKEIIYWSLYWWNNLVFCLIKYQVLMKFCWIYWQIWEEAHISGSHADNVYKGVFSIMMMMEIWMELHFVVNEMKKLWIFCRTHNFLFFEPNIYIYNLQWDAASPNSCLCKSIHISYRPKLFSILKILPMKLLLLGIFQSMEKFK